MIFEFEPRLITYDILNKISKLRYSKERSDVFNMMAVGSSFEYKVFITDQDAYISSIYYDPITNVYYVVMGEGI